LKSSVTQIAYTPHAGTTPEAELNALAAVYKFILSDSQASKGGSHDLTNDSTKECMTSQAKKGQDNANLHGD
jgi:hypothetical protein